ncbi:hexaprenyl pyrophosphate synthetase-like protein [Nemania sp. NC0429]|nr:hexaprenyl pyrophosphate synthetase-like protein [Nemania sp. NC0429]
MQLQTVLLNARATARPAVFSACSDCTRRRAAWLARRVAAERASYHSSPPRSSAWAAAVSVASNVVSNAVSSVTKGDMHIDPLRTVAKEMKFLTGNLRQLLGSGHPSLDRVAKYYTQAEGKHVRPLIVLLMSRATALCPKSDTASASASAASSSSYPAHHSVDSSISPLDILSDVNPSSPLAGYSSEPEFTDSDILPSQRRLAEITELIHTASLLHDDVVDHSVSRRGSPSANFEFGNKMAVLAGDFLLGRASVALARLRNAEVIELLATVIANLVEGEFMQLKNTARDERNPTYSEDIFNYYLQKTYLKTASLISKSCRAAALLGQANAITVDAAYAYGRNLGLAFQLVDDMLDYTKSGKDLGKPAGADLELGLATAPLLFAWKTTPELGVLVGRKFEKEGDVQRARDLVIQSNGIEQTRALAEDYSQRAITALETFPDSEAKEGLIEMATKTLKRQK